MARWPVVARRGKLLVLGVGLAGALGAVGRPAGAQIALVTNAESPVTELSADEVRRLFLGLSVEMPDKQRVALALYLPLTPAFCRTALGHSEDDLRKRWIAIAFRGDPGTPPVELPTAERVRQFVRQHRGALAFLPLAEADSTVRVLRIDGKRPGDAGYLLP